MPERKHFFCKRCSLTIIKMLCWKQSNFSAVWLFGLYNSTLWWNLWLTSKVTAFPPERNQVTKWTWYLDLGSNQYLPQSFLWSSDQRRYIVSKIFHFRCFRWRFLATFYWVASKARLVWVEFVFPTCCLVSPQLLPGSHYYSLGSDATGQTCSVSLFSSCFEFWPRPFRSTIYN